MQPLRSLAPTLPLSFILLILSIPPALVPAAEAQTKLDPDRVEQLAAMLPASLEGVGRPADDRTTWQAVARLEEFRSTVARAEAVVKQPMPELSDELFLDFSRTGNRSRCQRVIRERHGRLPVLVLAECIEGRGRFVPAIEETIRGICSEKTWVLPAHDRSLSNFNKTGITVDLASSAMSWQLATADYWLGERLNADVRKLIRSELEWRTFEPYEGYVKTGRPRLWWATGTNNWNAVCLAGVTGSALALIEPPERRARYVAAAEHFVGYFLRGFTADGYCSEGLGYWNYGFGNYAVLAETLRHATGGKLDLWQRPGVREIARFGRRMEIVPGVYPAFADCSVGTKPDAALMAVLDRRFDFGWGLRDQGAAAFQDVASNLPEVGLYVHGALSDVSAASPPPSATPAALPLREWFPEAGVLIVRPPAGESNGLGVALKGGHNAEHHNHNDVGTYLVSLGGNTPLVDPGSEVYTARTFSSRRYESDVLNSFGHPVPRVAGQLQRTGRAAAAKVLETEWTDRQDRIVLDLKAAYAVEGLEELRRTFVVSREGKGSLTVVDHVRFAGPQTFGTALVTFSPRQKTGPGRLLVGEGKGRVAVEITTDGPAFAVHEDEIHEDVRGGRLPVRVGIELSKPVREATITLQITPAP